jgi:hypothetical protein
VQIGDIQPQRPSESMKRIQSSRFSLEYVHQETTVGQNPLPGENQGDAAQVTADDVVLLLGEHSVRVRLRAALFECLKVSVTRDFRFQGSEVRPNLFNQLKSVGH